MKMKRKEKKGKMVEGLQPGIQQVKRFEPKYNCVFRRGRERERNRQAEIIYIILVNEIVYSREW